MLQDNLPKFLSPDQVAGAKTSGNFIAQLPEQSRFELGRVFGRSYNKQFKVILAFALLNFLVTIALAAVRKKKGIFGKTAVRNLENEFTRTGEREKQEKNSAVATGVVEEMQVDETVNKAQKQL